MLRRISEVLGYTLDATDGDIGSVEDILFTDNDWIVRYLLVKPGGWLTQSQVMIGREALSEQGWEDEKFVLNITREQIKEAPSLRADQPVSEQHKIGMNAFYYWPPYWQYLGTPLSGTTPIPTGMPVEPDPADSGDVNRNLRLFKEVKGYHIEADDGTIGHLEDLVMDDTCWCIRYAIIDTRNWLPGRKVLIAPEWIETFRWEDKEMDVNLTQEQIKESPEYDSSKPIDRQYEEALHNHYGCDKYWEQREQ